MAVKTPAGTRNQQKYNFVKSLKSVKTPLLFILGFIGGKQVIVLFDKNKTVSSVVGQDGKKLLAPAATALTGLAIAQVTKDQNFKMLGYGMTAAGIVDGAKKVTGKDLLSGLNLFGDDVAPEDIMGLGSDTQLPAATDQLLQDIMKSPVAYVQAPIDEDEPETEVDVQAPIVPTTPVQGLEGDDDFDDEDYEDVKGMGEADIDLTEVV